MILRKRIRIVLSRIERNKRLDISEPAVLSFASDDDAEHRMARIDGLESTQVTPELLSVCVGDPASFDAFVPLRK